MQGLRHIAWNDHLRLRNLESGMHYSKARILGKKRRGKRFQAFLAEIAVRSSGDPLIELLTFFCFRHFKAKTVIEL
jgi:hypothetical protein